MNSAGANFSPTKASSSSSGKTDWAESHHDAQGQGLIVTSSSGKGHTGTGRPRARALVSCFEECSFRSALSNEVTSTWHVKCHNGSECALLRPVWWGQRSWRQSLRMEGPGQSPE